jgi:hypothetical protein
MLGAEGFFESQSGILMCFTYQSFFEIDSVLNIPGWLDLVSEELLISQ